MTPDQFLRLTAAPEILVVDLVDAALVALDLALLVEHPLLESDDAAPDDPPVRRRARAVRRVTLRFRRALDAYRHEVDLALQEPPRDDLPF